MEVKYATSNGAYTAGRKITSPEGAVNHSVGCAQPSADVFYNLMNKTSAGWGVNAILGDFHKGEGRVLLTLPINARPWGCGKGTKGSWNNTKIQWETCEPSGHTYAGGTMVGYDVTKNQTYFDRMWTMLVAWNVYVIKKFGYSVSGISDHAESNKAGYGSNHSDMGQWLPKHGKSMDALRAEVQEILNYKEETNKEETEVAETRYNSIADMPDYAKATITKLVDKNVIGGYGTKKDEDGRPADLDLSVDMVRLLVFNDRAGLYGE
jgi:hypothetical protein